MNIKKMNYIKSKLPTSCLTQNYKENTTYIFKSNNSKKKVKLKEINGLPCIIKRN